MPRTPRVRKSGSASEQAPPTARRSSRALHVLVTAGPTHEPIDAVRYLSNRSSGTMGIAIADAAAELGCKATLLLGPTAKSPAHSRVKVKRFRTTADLQRLLAVEFPRCDALVMAAAVADYRPVAGLMKADQKIARSAKGLTLRLEATPDLLAGLKRSTRRRQTLVGFALEPADTMLERAAAKLARKRLDLIVANPLETMDAASIRGTILDRHGPLQSGTRALSKAAFARRLVKTVVAWHRATLDG